MIKKCLRGLFFALSILVFATSLSAQKTSRRFEISRNLDYFNLVYKYLDLYYVDSISPEKTIQVGINAMLKSLDPYTEFYTEEETKRFGQLMTGNYGGIGAIIMYHKNGRACIAEPYEGQPASESGLRAGDVLLEIDGKPLAGLTIAQISERLRGTRGSSLTVKVERMGEKKPIELKITRRTVHIPSVSYYGVYPDGVGYIHLNTFVGDATKEFKKAFQELKKQGITSLIIDLRDNGGGLLEAAVEIAGIFLPRGQEIVSTRRRGGEVNERFRTKDTPLDTQIPLLVMVNDESASASEILAGALQDLDRAVVIGERTLGKGLVQATRPLPYGASMKLTTAKYYIPSGRCVQRIAYSHADSMQAALPDSLRSVYYTAAGRKVYGGGGVLPDVIFDKIEKDYSLLYQLATGIDTLYNVFDFVTAYCLKYPIIAPAEQFELTDADISDFVASLKDRGFTYKSASEQALEKMKEVIAREGHEANTKAEMDRLAELLAHDLDRDVQRNKEELKQMIGNEIIVRYFFQRGRALFTLRYDKQFIQARALITDSAKMRQLLQ